jgi:hypothetical protein
VGRLQKASTPNRKHDFFFRGKGTSFSPVEGEERERMKAKELQLMMLLRDRGTEMVSEVVHLAKGSPPYDIVATLKYPNGSYVLSAGSNDDLYRKHGLYRVKKGRERKENTDEGERDVCKVRTLRQTVARRRIQGILRIRKDKHQHGDDVVAGENSATENQTGLLRESRNIVKRRVLRPQVPDGLHNKGVKTGHREKEVTEGIRNKQRVTDNGNQTQSDLRP